MTTPQTTSDLTDRQLHMLRLAAASYTNRQIARHLGLADDTVNHAMADIRGTLGTGTVAGSVARAIHAGHITHRHLEQPCPPTCTSCATSTSSQRPSASYS